MTSNAVDSSWLERTVQAFLSCVTTGNVKVFGFSGCEHLGFNQFWFELA